MRPTLPPIRRRRRGGTGTTTRVKAGGRPNATPSGVAPIGSGPTYVGGRRQGRIAGASRSAASSLFPRRRSSVVVRRLVLGVLLCASLGLITVTYRGGVVLHGAQLAVLDAVAPIERGLSRAWDPVAGAWNWAGRVVTSANENPRLREENAELREQLRIANDQAAEAEGYRRDLGFRERGEYPRGYEMVAARVIVPPASAVTRSLVLDRGSDDGVREGDAVTVAGGLLGIVTKVTSGTAVVSLIIDDARKVSASVSGSEAWGVLETVSTAGTPVMQLRGVKQSAKVAVHDEVFTSGFSSNGLESMYPKGIPIGQVTDWGNDPADLHKTVQVKPYADFDRVDHAYVLVPKDRAES